MESKASVFRDEEAARRTLSHLEFILGESLPSDVDGLFIGSADPDLALVNLSRWLSATANPQVHLQQLIALPKLSKLLLTILGASQPITDSLIQNPELASLVLDPAELGRYPTREAISTEGKNMLRTATSYSHSLDRLRFLKQRWTIPIVINDLAGSWPEEQVWTALSDLAEVLVELAVTTVWREYSRTTGSESGCPVMVVGFGKLGGRELNFSSDIDLVYAVPDGMEGRQESDATRFCELLGRALSDRMGRGSIYRIDLRLRPYGSSGPLVSTMRGFETYYGLYAEQWEIQALIRSKPICGPDELVRRWHLMRAERCFRPQLSEPELESMLSMKTRIEERSNAEDLKRGAGGIRDVEFLVQTLQLIHGHRWKELQIAPTLPVLRGLGRIGILEQPVVQSLEKGYVFLRQLEHRCQLVGDLQTHSIPRDAPARERLAKLMGAFDWKAVEGDLEVHRRTIQTLYRSTLRPVSVIGDQRDAVAAKLGALAPGVLQWFDSMPSSEAFYASLLENSDSLGRIERIAMAAPRLVNDFKASLALTEALMSGEIEEQGDPSLPLARMEGNAALSAVADSYRRARTVILARWVLQVSNDIWIELTDLADALLRYCAERIGASFDIVGLGSFGARELGIDSDADVLFLVSDSSMQSKAESQAQEFLALFGQLKRNGIDLGIDLRLRPDGGKGMLVRSHEALDAYLLSGMEVWEQFALGQARLVFGNDQSLVKVREIAYSKPLSQSRLAELLAMKRRMETERVMPQFATREIKLGYGGLNDIEWLVHLLEMHSSYIGMHTGADMTARIRDLCGHGLLNVFERDELLTARRHLLELRLWLSLLGFQKDIVPENPDKLDRLAKIMDFSSGHKFLAEHERVIESVRSIYLQVLERLKA